MGCACSTRRNVDMSTNSTTEDRVTLLLRAIRTDNVALLSENLSSDPLVLPRFEKVPEASVANKSDVLIADSTASRFWQLQADGRWPLLHVCVAHYASECVKFLIRTDRVDNVYEVGGATGTTAVDLALRVALAISTQRADRQTLTNYRMEYEMTQALPSKTPPTLHPFDYTSKYTTRLGEALTQFAALLLHSSCKNYCPAFNLARQIYTSGGSGVLDTLLRCKAAIEPLLKVDMFGQIMARQCWLVVHAIVLVHHRIFPPQARSHAGETLLQMYLSEHYMVHAYGMQGFQALVDEGVPLTAVSKEGFNLLHTMCAFHPPFENATLLLKDLIGMLHDTHESPPRPLHAPVLVTVSREEHRHIPGAAAVRRASLPLTVTCVWIQRLVRQSTAGFISVTDGLPDGNPMMRPARFVRPDEIVEEPVMGITPMIICLLKMLQVAQFANPHELDETERQTMRQLRIMIEAGQTEEIPVPETDAIMHAAGVRLPMCQFSFQSMVALGVYHPRIRVVIKDNIVRACARRRRKHALQMWHAFHAAYDTPWPSKK